MRSRDCAVSSRIGVTCCKHGGTGSSDRFCPPIQGETGVVGFPGKEGEVLAAGLPAELLDEQAPSMLQVVMSVMTTNYKPMSAPADEPTIT